MGWPLVAEALDEPGWWQEIFHRGRKAAEWYEPKGVADALVICHTLAAGT